jgi:hypothetical protein
MSLCGILTCRFLKVRLRNGSNVISWSKVKIFKNANVKKKQIYMNEALK